MKQLMQWTGGFALAGALCLAASDEKPSVGYVDFGKLAAPASGGEFVEVQISSNLIGMAARLVEKHEPQVASVIRDVKHIRVNVIGLTDENRAEMQQRVQKIREQLDHQKWERIVTAQQKDEDVGVYLKMRGEEAVEGLVVTVLQGDREAVLVNIVGNIQPDKIAMIGERFNIEPLKELGEKMPKK
jgi:hypothetical protein